MKHLLENYQLQRFNWAFEAKDDYLSKFKVFEAEDKQIDSKRIVISVYGPTQVGKSTLILTLLGLKNEYLSKVSKFLRGKRDTGESATVTVTIYQISSTDYFQVKLPNKEVQIVKTEEELENLLSQLRYDIEEGLIHSVEPVVIAIPKYMFEESEHILEIIDLPGIESAEQKEVQHVERCINYWIPNSHVCLIVNSANDLTFLRDIEMPQLMHWYDYESNYFLILTRAITPKSIKRAMQNGKIQTSEHFIEYYKDYIEDILKHRKGTVFPLEIGDSFQNLNEKEQQLANGTLQTLKDTLNEVDIHKISFNYLSGYYRDILKQEKVEIDNLNEQLEEKIKFIKELQFNQKYSYEKNKSSLDELKKDLALLNNQLEIIQNTDFPHLSYENTIEQVLRDSPITKRASGANKLISNLVTSLEDTVNKKINILNGSFRKIATELQLKNVKQIEQVSINFTFWDNSKIDKYLSESNYLKQRNAMGFYLNVLLKEQLDAIQIEITKRLKIILHFKNDLDQAIYNLEAMMKNDDQHYRSLIETEDEDRQTLQKRLAVVHDMWERDKAHALQYKEYFIKHFIKRKDELLEMATSKNYEQQYLAFLFLQVLGEDAKKIIDSMEIENEENKIATKTS